MQFILVISHSPRQGNENGQWNIRELQYKYYRLKCISAHNSAPYDQNFFNNYIMHSSSITTTGCKILARNQVDRTMYSNQMIFEFINKFPSKYIFCYYINLYFVWNIWNSINICNTTGFKSYFSLLWQGEFFNLYVESQGNRLCDLSVNPWYLKVVKMCCTIYIIWLFL